MIRLEKFYKKYVVPKLQKKLNIKNIMAIPKIYKIVINMGVGEASKNKKLINHARKDIEIISGQKSIITKTKKSISGFKIRENWPIGCKVTLRRKKMYDFLEKLIRITIPRIRDFRGLRIKSFDGYGNYNLGIKEQISFPEINYNKIDKIRGLNITINTTAKNNNIGKNLLLELGFPLKI